MFDPTRLVTRDLIDLGRIGEAELAAARTHAAREGLGVVEALLALGKVDHREVAIARARAAGVPFVDLDHHAINAGNAALISKQTIREMIAFPLFVVGGVVTVGMADPTERAAVDHLRRQIGQEIYPVACEEPALRSLIDRLCGERAA